MNEFTAPVMMPVILLMMVLFDKLRHEPAPIPAMGQWDQTLDHKPTAQQITASSERSLLTAPDSPLRQYGFFKALHLSTSETVGHIGALVILMALSVSVGGYLERIEIMEAFPTDISSIFIVISLIVALMIL